MENYKPVWLITGCSSGFGRQIANQALARGFAVVATARNRGALDELAEAYPETCFAVALDVDEASQRQAVVAGALERFGRIDVLVNNAGYGYLAAVEEGEDGEIRAMFETNFFALAALTREVLPGMRAQRSGRIVNISSVGGLVGIPGVGYYNATKFAVEGLSEALAAEVAPLGIRVILVEPGPFRTDWAGRSLRAPTYEIDDYHETAGARRRRIAGYSGHQPGDPARAATVILEAALSENPPLRLVLGRIALEMVENKLEAVRADVERLRDVSLAADFPEAR